MPQYDNIADGSSFSYTRSRNGEDDLSLTDDKVDI